MRQSALTWSGAVLPCDALAAVLGHVADVDLKKMASRVCRAWRSASALPRAWSSMTIDNGRGARIVGEVEAIGLIRRHGSEMRVLSIADERMQLLDAQNTGPSKEGSIISSALVAAIATHCPELHSLELRARKDADLAAATEVVALVEGIAASRPGGKIRLLGCNLLRGQSLARCGKLVETMTSGECCGGRCSSSQRTSYADFFEDPVLWRMNEVSHVLERRGVFLCTVAGCTGGAMCTSCACGSQDSVRILHCKTCKRTCCQDCLDLARVQASRAAQNAQDALLAQVSYFAPIATRKSRARRAHAAPCAASTAPASSCARALSAARSGAQLALSPRALRAAMCAMRPFVVRAGKLWCLAPPGIAGGGQNTSSSYLSRLSLKIEAMRENKSSSVFVPSW
eukprot:CAMPEP_0206226896 /NCGR_PEP_ID=MMETSP0047_2-20121206/8335_1 /ASSEMBLY_ACC=CAM_ASM_000192 /TAXON_ID=195065 /ORGANISM="Chroomonas mesostigmatica_cf, Strain CCMP1168" /LENGTH=398 /DNA_ID=CAMNT_0053650013 /DNA_START=164 /DNA_END=1358 /DNA_ORIENTATION=+